MLIVIFDSQTRVQMTSIYGHQQGYLTMTGGMETVIVHLKLVTSLNGDNCCSIALLCICVDELLRSKT